VRQTIKALGWAIRFLWIIVLLLPVSVAFSLWKLAEPGNIGIREPEVAFSGGAFSLSAPFYINNTGFYDLSDANLTISIGHENEVFKTFSSFVPHVPAGTTWNSSYQVSLALQEVASSMGLLTNDTDLVLGMSASFRVAYVIAFGVSTNFSQPWKAPFHNLTIPEVGYDSSTRKISMIASFENHANFPLEGEFLLEVYNNRSRRIGYFMHYINVASDAPYSGSYEFEVDEFQLTDNEVIRLSFDGVKIYETEWIPG
jgi:hypothetical protein